jgi:hypothetical protein
MQISELSSLPPWKDAFFVQIICLFW